jgi:hypothetical protein
VTIHDTIHEGYAEKGWDCFSAELAEGGLGIILSVVPEVGTAAMIVLDVSVAEEGPVVSVRAFSETGKPADLARLDLGQMLLHVRPT